MHRWTYQSSVCLHGCQMLATVTKSSSMFLVLFPLYVFALFNRPLFVWVQCFLFTIVHYFFIVGSWNVWGHFFCFILTGNQFCRWRETSVRDHAGLIPHHRTRDETAEDNNNNNNNGKQRGTKRAKPADRTETDARLDVFVSCDRWQWTYAGFPPVQCVDHREHQCR